MDARAHSPSHARTAGNGFGSPGAAPQSFVNLTRPALPPRTALITLTCGKFALVDELLAPALMAFSWHVVPSNSGNLYAARSSEPSGGIRQRVWMHHQVLQLPNDEPVDHWNGDGLDNRLENLRPATAAQNAWNSKARRGSSPYKGVTRSKRREKWEVRLRKNGVLIQVGSFIDEIEAARAYDVAAVEYYGPFARVNFP